MLCKNHAGRSKAQGRLLRCGRFLASFVPALAVFGCVSQSRSEDSLPNIVWIVGENICLDLTCYGAAQVHTPNLDGLAASGVRYTNVFATSPVCRRVGRHS